ncbi:uncharacterized protein LOC128905414 isoform X1 [Rissa tridactyla]|uniref:uncharacterized protein LOC128905414 isoform X1 n=1 Tax=Rissa tridactyla TaxID=75485 RepID=UPI0023BB14AE|nr:uncharacterized protein LOC128905414 isoform X1 [Rissa tridactyla]
MRHSCALFFRHYCSFWDKTTSVTSSTLVLTTFKTVGPVTGRTRYICFDLQPLQIQSTRFSLGIAVKSLCCLGIIHGALLFCGLTFKLSCFPCQIVVGRGKKTTLNIQRCFFEFLQFTPNQKKMKGKRKTCKMDSRAEGISQDPMGTGFGALQRKELSSPIVLSFVQCPPCQNLGRFHSCIIELGVDTLLLNLWPCFKLQSFETSQQTLA